MSDIIIERMKKLTDVKSNLGEVIPEVTVLKKKRKKKVKKVKKTVEPVIEVDEVPDDVDVTGGTHDSVAETVVKPEEPVVETKTVPNKRAPSAYNLYFKDNYSNFLDVEFGVRSAAIAKSWKLSDEYKDDQAAKKLKKERMKAEKLVVRKAKAAARGEKKLRTQAARDKRAADKAAVKAAKEAAADGG